jgi:hypothetical protein
MGLREEMETFKDEGSEFAVSKHAVDTTLEITSNVYWVHETPAPEGKCVPDGRNGVEVYFRQGGKEVHLIVPGHPGRKPFIFMKDLDKPKTFSGATGEMLAVHLLRLTE